MSMEQMKIFTPSALETFSGAYPSRPVQVRHELAAHPLLEIDRLVQLGNSLPEGCLEYNLGDIEIDQSVPGATPVSGLSVEDTLKQIANCGSWLALRNIEHDPAYKALLDGCLEQVLPLAGEKTPAVCRPEGYIFVSSPDAITPFHFDPDHNILLQVRGEKTMHVFPAGDPEIVSAPQHEAYHDGAHCNLVYDEARLSPKATPYQLGPGDALHVPVKAPHWVRNGPEVSVSLSITWRSDASDRERRVYLLNNRLRKAGLNPSVLGAYPFRDQMKDLAAKAIGKAGML